VQRLKAWVSDLLEYTKQSFFGLSKTLDIAKILDRIRDDYGIGKPEEYTLLNQKDWETTARNYGYTDIKFESGKHGATKSGWATRSQQKSIVTVSTDFVTKTLKKG
jgi:hypothetical protein